MPNRKLSPSVALLAVFVCTCLTPTASAQSNDTKTRPSGSISGTVTINDKPVSDILVVAQFVDRPSLQPSLPRTKTDATGRYRLSGLAPGQYQIIAVAPAMSFAERENVMGYASPNKTIVLSADEEIDDIDIKLTRGSVITGRVTDEDGKPVVEQRVSIEFMDAGRNVGRQPNAFGYNYQMNQTDDRGIYRIYGLPAGRYRVSVGSNEADYYGPNNRAFYRLTFYGDTSDATKASVVELAEGAEATKIDIHLGHSSSTFTATGRLVDDSGQPIPGVRLMHGPARANQPFYGVAIGAPTGPKGEFRLDGLQPGRYGVSISSTFDASPFYADPLFFEITDSDVINLELKATRGLTLSGVVTFEGGRARELQQQIGGMRMIAGSVSATNAGNQVSASAGLSADGAFQIGGLRPGKLRLSIGTISNSSIRGVAILRVERDGVDVTQSLEVQPGESISNLRVIAGLGNGTIRGTVRVTGGPVPSNIYFYVYARREGSNANGFGVVDTRGKFVIGNLIAGIYELTLQASFNGGTGRPIPPQKQTVNVSDNSESQVDLLIDLTPKDGPP